MRYSISNTAEYGDYTRGKRVITDETRANMRKILEEIQSGDFAREWIAENRAGQENFKRMRAEQADTQVEHVGRRAALAHGLDQARLLARSAPCSPTSSGTGPRASRSAGAYEQRASRFHRSLARSLPVGPARRLFRVTGSRGRSPRHTRRRRARRLGPTSNRAARMRIGTCCPDFAALGCSTRPPSGAGTAAATTRSRAASGREPAALYGLIEGEPPRARAGRGRSRGDMGRPAAGRPASRAGRAARRRHGPRQREPVATPARARARAGVLPARAARRRAGVAAARLPSRLERDDARARGPSSVAEPSTGFMLAGEELAGGAVPAPAEPLPRLGRRAPRW